jgi:hypothetical protein
MAHKKKDAPRKLYLRAKVPFVCYAGQYFAPELRADSTFDKDAEVVLEEILDEDEKLIALDGTQGDTTERMTPFTFERKQRAVKAETETAEGEEGTTPQASDGDEEVQESNDADTVIVGDEGNEDNEADESLASQPGIAV